jgi:hypothetical protein
MNGMYEELIEKLRKKQSHVWMDAYRQADG